MEHTWKSKPRTYARIEEMLKLGLLKECPIPNAVLTELANGIAEDVDGKVVAELRHELVGKARSAWCNAVLSMSPDPHRTAELRQMLVDAMDVVEQSDDEVRLIAALKAFDGSTS